MAFSSLFKKATDFVGGLVFGADNNLKPPPLDGEIIYCKNNVCVHPPVGLGGDTKPIPGYVNIRCQDDKDLGSTLILTWIPNSTLKKNPRSVQNSPRLPRRSPRKSPRKRDYAAPEYRDSGQEDISIDNREKSHDQASILSNSSLEEPLAQNAKKDNVSIKSPDSGVSSENVSLESQQRHYNEQQSLSSESESLTTEAKLKILLESGHDRSISGSKRSISVEMDGDNLVVTTIDECEEVFEAEHDVLEKFNHDSPSQDTDVDFSMSSGSTLSTPSTDKYNQMITDIREGLQSTTADQQSHVQSNTSDTNNKDTIDETKDTDIIPEDSIKTHTRGSSKDLKLDLKTNISASDEDYNLGAPNISLNDSGSLASCSTSGPDSVPPSPGLPTPGSQMSSPGPGTPHSNMSYPDIQYDNPELFAVSHNLTFPENSVSFVKNDDTSANWKSARDQICGVFSIDLGQMRSLRLFYNDEEQTSGQLVIASRESQYKILHFHHGGLNKLAQVLEDWNLFVERKYNKKDNDFQKSVKQFSVMRPDVSDDQFHPEEGCYNCVTMETWKQYMTEDGTIDDSLSLRKAIFFGGIDTSIRHEAWPFLLQYYLWESTFDERDRQRNDKYLEYQDIRKLREEMKDEEKEDFWRRIQSIVEKDVVRTDRTHPYFRGENNPNIQVLQSILLNYAMYNPKMGYNQGMSDLLAPILAEIQNEADAYWCFVGLMQRTIFFSSPKDSDMDKQLNYLKDLLSIMHPAFYNHIVCLGDASELLFCHRWILLCFKREFPEEDALKIWEACWSHYQTDYFHLFVCLAIISIYGDDVIQQALPADEMLLHFSSLAMHMSGRSVLQKARGLLHTFRQRPTIPCSLHGLCRLCGPGMWDSGHEPKVRCVGYHEGEQCPAYQSPPQTPH